MRKPLLILWLAVSAAAHGQNINITEGSLAFLKTQNSLQTEFVYDNIMVPGNKTEADYLAKNKEAMNRKEAGRGDRWEKAWYDCRKERGEPQFRELFSKRSKIQVSDEPGTYTLIFKSLRFFDDDLLIESGMDAEINRDPAYMDAEVWIVETQNPGQVMVKLLMTHIPGRLTSMSGSWSGNSAYYDVKIRLALAYARAGDMLGRFVATSLGR